VLGPWGLLVNLDDLWAAYLRALVLPDPQYVTGRHRSRLVRFGYAIREARRGRGRR
jgi:hypothetical protein